MIFALYPLLGLLAPLPSFSRPLLSRAVSEAANQTSTSWTRVQNGTTGVLAMQLTVISEEYAVIVDKVEHNPLEINGHSAWSALYNLKTNDVTPLDLKTNSFCAAGSFLADGTLINVGGNAIDTENSLRNYTDGTQGLRIMSPCDGASCTWHDDPSSIHLSQSRWYPSVTRLDDGSAIIIGGANQGGFINSVNTNTPSYEFYPPKGVGGVINSAFLADTVNANLFPISFLLPDGRIFMAANTEAIVYDWKNNVETKLPSIPNGVRVTYPMSGTGVLLPLSEANDLSPEVLICGGSTITDQVTNHNANQTIDASDPASDQCSRMVLTTSGISAGWQVEKMPHPWLMGDAVMMPEGKVLLTNGCRSGVAGYGNVKHMLGKSNCATPILQPVLYDPAAAAGSRFSSEGIPSSEIPRGYHSVATLVPDGRVMIAGSSPCADVNACGQEMPTEFQVEWLLSPSLSTSTRPTYTGLPASLPFGSSFNLTSVIPSDAGEIKVALMDLGYKTHAVSANMRLVYLTVERNGNGLTVSTPPNGQVYPPGPAYVFLTVDGVSSEGTRVLVGSGVNPA